VRNPKGQTYILRAIPWDLWKQVKAKARAEGRTIRWVILRLLAVWVRDAPRETL